MAARNWNVKKTLGVGLVEIAGSFAPNGAGAVDATTREGRGYSVVRSGVGVFTVTFKDSYAAIVSMRGAVALSALADTDVQFGAFSQANKTLVINIKTAGVAADIAANAANRIHFSVTFRNTKTPPLLG